MSFKDEKKIEREIIKSPLGDDDIKNYLPNAKIIKYSELKKYKNIEDLLPNNNTYVIILIENDYNKGHWVALMRYKDKKRKTDIIELFDSIADDGSPDSQLKWNKPQKNKELGQDKKLLTYLLNKSDLPVIYNKFKFQSEGNGKDGNIINTCGRHCIFRILTLLNNGFNLEDYLKLMKTSKKQSKNTYDEIVSHLIQDKITF